MPRLAFALLFSFTIGPLCALAQEDNTEVRVSVVLNADASRTVYETNAATQKTVATTTGKDGKLREKTPRPNCPAEPVADETEVTNQTEGNEETKDSAACAWTSLEGGALRRRARRARPSTSEKISNLRSLCFLLLKTNLAID